MYKEKKLMKDTMLYAIANFGSSALAFLMLPLYTHYFTTEEFGLWDLTITTITLLVPFVTFELTAATYRWLLDTKEDDKRSAIISTGFFQILRHLIVVNILLIILFFFVILPFQWEALLLMNIMVISSFLQQCARGLSRNKLFASLGIMQSIIIVLLNLLFILYFQLRVEAFFYAYSIAGIVVILVAWKRMRFSSYLVFSKRSQEIRSAYFQYAIPIIPAAASWWIMTMSDRWMIAGFLGVSMNGIYAIAVKIPAILLMINTVFSLAWKDSAILNFHIEDKNRYYSLIFKHYFRLLATSVICLTLLAKPLLALFIDPAYFEAWKYSGILLIAALFNALSLFWSAGFHGAKKTKALLGTTVIGAGVNVVLNLVLIPFIGLYAVALSTLIAFVVTWGLRVRAAKEYFNIGINMRDVFILLVVMLGVVSLPFIVSCIGLTVSIGMSGVLFVGYNWRLIKRVLART